MLLGVYMRIAFASSSIVSSSSCFKISALMESPSFELNAKASTSVLLAKSLPKFYESRFISKFVLIRTWLWKAGLMIERDFVLSVLRIFDLSVSFSI